jgi:hypothetical protein
MSYLVNPPFLAAIMKRWELRVSQALGDDLYFSPAWTRKYPDVAAGMGATNEYGGRTSLAFPCPPARANLRVSGR